MEVGSQWWAVIGSLTTVILAPCVTGGEIAATSKQAYNDSVCEWLVFAVTRSVVFRNPLWPKNAEFSSNHVLSESSVNGNVSHSWYNIPEWSFSALYHTLFAVSLCLDQVTQRPHSKSNPASLEHLVAEEEKGINCVNHIPDQFIDDIISSTPELSQFHGFMNAR